MAGPVLAPALRALGEQLSSPASAGSSVGHSLTEWVFNFFGQFGQQPGTSAASQGWAAAVDITERKDAYLVLAAAGRAGNRRLGRRPACGHLVPASLLAPLRKVSLVRQRRRKKAAIG
jgi:hypothetical protein